ncbi:hypothetical protein CRE_02461 [Caenorhabditis remanei]|uniref:Uncharacterized protein n=1 Tax=Caenorhabditis remanei TaxID=31234 RepID=E3MWM7_CAERE|nr:hypothetical protein CRE_02461 [Caenorhabditis remanei]
MMVIYVPIFFHKHKHIFFSFPILAIATSFGLTEPIVLFGFCRYDFNIPKTCAAFGCAANQCFLTYWSTHKLIILAFILPFSILICLKLFLMYRGKTRESRQLSRANRLAIIDAAIIFCFDFLPIVASKFVVFSFQMSFRLQFVGYDISFSPYLFSQFQNVGPHGAVLQSVGLAIESLLFYRTLSPKSSFQSSDSTIHKIRVKTCTF